MMPGMDGFHVLKEIRRTSKVPVLMLTARGEADDKFAGFENGADDYLVKPFLPKELLFRVQAILKRSYPKQEKRVYLDASTVDLEKAEVQRDSGIYPLTAKELTLFEKLYQNAGRIVTTGALCQAVCGEFWQGYEKHFPRISATCGRRSKLIRPDRFPSLRSKASDTVLILRRHSHEVHRAFFPSLYSLNDRNPDPLLSPQYPAAWRVFCDCRSGKCKNSNFPIEELSRHIEADSGQFHIDAQAEEILADSGAWAMILNDSGIVIWEQDLPAELARRYTATEVAMFSRWYLDDYPVNIWKRSDGLLVVGLPPGDIVNYYFSLRQDISVRFW